MPDYFSYIDTALRVIYINRASPISQELTGKLNALLEEIETSTHVRQHLFRRQIANQFRQDKSLNELLIHEFHHYLQSLYYPFLFYINWLEFDNLIYLRNLIKSSDEPQFKIKELGLTGEQRQNFLYLSQKFQLQWIGDRLWMKIPDEDAPSMETFNLNDLLEDSTTIFQYKALNSNANAGDFYDYALNPANKCYRRLYKFLVKKLGKQFTYDLLPIFVQVAFSTTEPIGAFCNIVSYAILNFQDYDLFSAGDLFEMFLSKLEGSLGTYNIDPLNDTYIHALPNQVLRHEQIKDLIDFAYGQEEFFHYPFALHARKFSQEINKDPALLYKLININKASFENLLDMFEPMAIHFQFTEMNGRNASLILGKDYAEEPGPLGSDYAFYIKELLKVKEIVQGLLTNIQSLVPANCHHRECAYYPLQICKKYNSIPKEYQACGFPELFTVIFHRKINLQTETIDKLPKEQVDQNWENYIAKSYKKRHFNYVESDGCYILTVGKDDFGQADKINMFSRFLDYLIQEKVESHASLCGRISLDFYGFDDDARGINEIPETRQWILQTLLEVPYFLCYIKFDSAVNHFEMLLPVLIQHSRKRNHDGKSGLYII
jgi:hypothetical protein